MQGENPSDVFTEIELFYIIREALNNLNPGRSGYSPDEYDLETNYLLDHILAAHENKKEITTDEYAVFVEKYFVQQFGEAKSEKIKAFAINLFENLHSMEFPSSTIRGTDFPSMLKVDSYP